jgi:hypothetical protein
MGDISALAPQTRDPANADFMRGATARRHPVHSDVAYFFTTSWTGRSARQGTLVLGRDFLICGCTATR